MITEITFDKVKNSIRDLKEKMVADRLPLSSIKTPDRLPKDIQEQLETTKGIVSRFNRQYDTLNRIGLEEYQSKNQELHEAKQKYNNANIGIKRLISSPFSFMFGISSDRSNQITGRPKPQRNPKPVYQNDESPFLKFCRGGKKL